MKAFSFNLYVKFMILDSLKYHDIHKCMMLLYFQQLAWQLAGVSSILAWTSVLSFIMFFTLKKVHLLRVGFQLETKGRT